MDAEKRRLDEDQKREKHWRRWGPYLSERQWATVREDYSENGDVWNSFPHDHARSRIYRWGEDGIGGLSDNHQVLCFAPAFWNGVDPILKERLFGLTGNEGNHGEDVKEYYFHLTNTPTHSYMLYLYKYPQQPFPYQKLVDENRKRGLKEREYELVDTGIFSNSDYFDLFIEYAKNDADDLFIQIHAVNRGKEKKPLTLLPLFWFRNHWAWNPQAKKPCITLKKNCLEATHDTLGTRYLYFEGAQEILFTENETRRKSAFHDYLIKQEKGAVNPKQEGTRAGLCYRTEIAPGASFTVRLRLSDRAEIKNPFADCEKVVEERKKEAEEFYRSLASSGMGEEQYQIQKQALSGMLWSKQYYHYVVEDWLRKDPLSTGALPFVRKGARNADWIHLYNDDILSVPDKWEYPCFFSWDTAFHALPLAMVDPEFAKKMLLLLTREWYMHPNGQLPASEWSFDDVNPPVQAWAAWRIYKMEQRVHNKRDFLFLERVFQKLLLNFTWWVNRKDSQGKNIFQAGFLGMDNIGIFNRSEQIPRGGMLYQSDATSWMGMFCLSLLTIALELAKENPAYEDMASKFFEHFLYISDAINYQREAKLSLWNEEDGFYYDLLVLPDGTRHPLKVRSLVGVVPLFAVTVLSKECLLQHKGFTKRLDWFLNNRTDLCEEIANIRASGREGRKLLSIVNEGRLKRVLSKLLDEEEFLSPYGIRSLSKYHLKNPFVLELDSQKFTVAYDPAESTTRIFGGNSNWCGPIWFPLNMLIIESLQKFHYYFGDGYKVECPTGSGRMMTLWEVASEISNRLVRLFLRDPQGKRPIYGEKTLFQHDPHWKDYLIFPEYFHAETGEGLGASHQTGWTGLVAKLIQQLCVYDK